MSEELPRIILVQWIPEVDRYRVIYPYFKFEGKSYHPGIIFEKYEYDNLLRAIKKAEGKEK